MKKTIVGMVSAVILGLIVVFGYSTYKKKNNEGFCWERMKRLSDDELYQTAMVYMIDSFQKEQKKQRKSHDFCKYAENCKIWMIKEPSNILQIKQKMELSWNKPMSEIIKIFNMQTVDKAFFLEHLQQNNNRFTLFNNIDGLSTFTPYDCCEVLSVDKIAQLKMQYHNDGEASRYLKLIEPEKQPVGRRYLRYKTFISGIEDSGVSYRDGLTGKFDFDDLKNVSWEWNRYFPLTSCGKILSN